MRIFDNYGRSNEKTMELACQIAETIKGKQTVVVAPIEELIEYENNSIREFAEWLEEKEYLVNVTYDEDEDDDGNRVYDENIKWLYASEVLAEYEKGREYE